MRSTIRKGESRLSTGPPRLTSQTGLAHEVCGILQVHVPIAFMQPRLRGFFCRVTPSRVRNMHGFERLGWSPTENHSMESLLVRSWPDRSDGLNDHLFISLVLEKESVCSLIGRFPVRLLRTGVSQLEAHPRKFSAGVRMQNLRKLASSSMHRDIARHPWTQYVSHTLHIQVVIWTDWVSLRNRVLVITVPSSSTVWLAMKLFKVIFSCTTSSC